MRKVPAEGLNFGFGVQGVTYFGISMRETEHKNRSQMATAVESRGPFPDRVLASGARHRHRGSRTRLSWLLL